MIQELLWNQGKIFLQLSEALEKQWTKKYRDVKGLISLEKQYRVAREHKTQYLYEKESFRDKKREIYEGLLPPPYQLTAPEVTLRGLRMEPRQTEKVIMTFYSDRHDKAIYKIYVNEQIRGETVGGILFIVRTGYGNE